MSLLLRGALVAIVVGVGAGSAAAQTSGASPSTDLDLTPQQRSAIFRTVISEREKVRLPPATNPAAAVGAQMPPSIELYMLPDTIGAEVPAAKLYKYTILQNQVVIVDPTTLKIIDVIRQ
jgi:hypothetical protein